MRVWISCTVVGVVACSAGAFAYGCGVSAFQSCAENGTCVGDGGPDASMPDGSMGNDASDGGGGGDVVGSDVTGDVVPGEAGCPSPTTLDCNGTCVDPTQPSHCGTCNNVCEGGTPECSGGTCSSGCMPPMPTNCSGSCVNEQDNPQHCGGCTTVCPGPDGGTGTATCVDAGCGYECAADGGTPTLCGSLCVNTTTDPNHCGGCGTVCPVIANGSPACVAGSGGTPTCGAACGVGFHGGGTLCETTCLPNTDDPSTDPCVVANAYGTFVSPSGSDAAGCGTMASPCLTIANATTVAKAATKRVYACGTFITAQTVTSAGDGVTVYGGFDCTGWTYSASTPTTVAPGTAGYALTVTGTTTGVTFEHFVFTALSAPDVVVTNVAAQSSVAIFANGAVLTLTDVSANAGNGQPGAGGSATFANYSGTNTDVGGTAGTVAGGKAGGPNNCLDGVTTTSGGTGATYNGATASPGTSTPTVGSTNGGGSFDGSCTGGATCDGANGLAPTTGASGAQTFGGLGSGGWTAAGPGDDGSDGNPGQGGGGGGAWNDPSGITGGPGGGGGAGGCGGGKGYGGQTGGASIGILAFDSTVTLTGDTVTITTATGGTGGSGSAAQDGQAGAVAGMGKGGCNGGVGGTGGGGGGGGGGAGGPSAGIVWKGTAPIINGATVTSASTATGITLGGQGSPGGGGNGGGGGGNGGAGGGDGATPTAMAVYQSP